MRERLLHHFDLFRKLRQLLVLFTLLLMPQMAGAVDYYLWIGGVRVTDANKTGITNGDSIQGEVTFDSEYNILTLNNATIKNCITSSLNNLTIRLKGTTNKVNTDAGTNGDGNNVAIRSTNITATLTIEREENAETSLELKAKADNSIISGFASVSYGTGNKQTYLLASSPAEYDNTNKYFHRYWPSESAYLNQATITSAVTYPIWVSGTQITHANLGSGTYTYDETDNALVLNGINIGPADGYCICSAVASLNVKLVGTNSISITRPFYNFYNGDATISFTTDIANPGTLSLTCSAASAPDDVIIGFSNGNNPTVSNGLAWLPTISNGKTTSATITPVSVMVAGNVPAANGSIVGTGISGTVTFTPATASTPNILTLDEATITGQIISNVGDLTIHITKGNTINAANATDTYVISSTNNGKLTFETDATIDNDLSFRDASGGYFANVPINGFSSIEYETGLGYYTSFSEIEEILYVEYNNNTYKLNSSNKDNIVGDGGTVKYSYDSTNGHVLTLDEASIDYVFWNNDADLTIALNGTCRIIADGTGHTNSINSGGKLNIVKVSGAPSAELKMSVYGGSPINATGLTLESGLYLKPTDTDKAEITDNPEFVLYNGYAMTNGQTINDSQQTPGTVTYTVSGSEKTLTFTNFQSAFGDGNGHVNAIETGVVGLKVKLIGDNKITCNDNGAFAFKSIQSNASIQFVKDVAASKLTMTTTSANPISGFGEGKVTYDGLLYYSSSGNDKYIFTSPTAPVLEVSPGEDNGLWYTYATIDYASEDKIGGTAVYGDASPVRKYSFDYVDSKLPDVTNQTYTDAIKMTAPGILTAWVEVAGAKSAETKGVRFGILENPIEMEFKGESKQIDFTPAPTMTNPVTVSISDAITFATHDATNNKLTINNCFDGRVSVSFANTDGGYTKLNMDSTLVTFHVKPIAPTLSLESGVYYVNQQVNVTPGITGNDYVTELKINDGSSPVAYPHTFSSVYRYGYGVRAITKYTPSNIASDYAEAKYYICNTPAFTGQYADQSSYTGNQNGNVYVVITSSYLPDGCKLMYYTGSDQSKAVAFTEAIQLNETTTINAFIRYTSNEGPTVTYDSEPVSQTFTVNQTLDIPPFGAGINYQTCFLPNYSLTKPEGLKVYTITNVSDNSVVVSEIEEYIPKGVAVLLEKVGDEPANGYSAQTYSGTIGDFSSNKLKYAYEIVETTGDQYVLYNNEFVKATGDIPQTKCYLDLSGAAHSRGMYDIGNGTTAIKGIEPDTTENDHDVWFDLQGRRIAKPTKAGLYIVNGKKVVINNK